MIQGIKELETIIRNLEIKIEGFNSLIISTLPIRFESFKFYIKNSKKRKGGSYPRRSLSTGITLAFKAKSNYPSTHTLSLDPITISLAIYPSKSDKSKQIPSPQKRNIKLGKGMEMKLENIFKGIKYLPGRYDIKITYPGVNAPIYSETLTVASRF